MQERDLINSIAAKATGDHPSLKKGIGDDCAILKSLAGSDLLVTADMLVENVHFDTRWHPPYLLGRKSLAVNISDIAGMGGTPLFALLSIGIPAKYKGNWTDQFIDGFLSLLGEYNSNLIGGDTVAADELTISVTMIGSASENKAICRENAKPGDAVYVSGNLGSSAAGLYLYQNGKVIFNNISSSEWKNLIKKHLDPTPRIPLGQALLESGYVTAMQDISDGIATDLSHLCKASHVSAIINESELPGDEKLFRLCEINNLNPTDFQIRGGEDYELVFTVQRGCEDKLENFISHRADTPAITRIGTIEKGQGVSMRTRHRDIINIEYQGYEHQS